MQHSSEYRESTNTSLYKLPDHPEQSVYGRTYYAAR